MKFKAVCTAITATVALLAAPQAAGQSGFDLLMSGPQLWVVFTF